MKLIAIVSLALLATPAVAFADELPAPPPPIPSPIPPPNEPIPEPVPEPAPAPAADPRVDELMDRLQKAEDELAQLRDDHDYVEGKVNSLLPIAAKLGGYLDIGFFATDGNGAGTRSDLLGTYFPEYAGKVPGSWVFMGDPLSTTVNSRGDVADTGDSRAVTFDPINSRGKSTFLVNAVNLALFTGIGETGQANISVDFIPRARDVSDVAGLFNGDYLDVKLAYGEWHPRNKKFGLMLQAGKFDSVLGYEYRSLESPDRLGVTPSLICRYTCGRNIGVKARAKFLDENLILNVAVTNGSSFSEGFPFADETDTNQWKTTSGRLSYSLFDKKVEVGVSGAYGAQDYQPSSDIFQWHLGADVHVEWKDLEFTGELVKGHAPGQTSATADPMAPCDDAPCLTYKGAYGLVGYHLTNVFIPYARVDWRDALHQSGESFVYISQLFRTTVGVRAELGDHVILKAEGTLNRELGRIPQFPNDVITTSLVIKI